MALFAYTVGGGGAILIGLWESVTSISESTRGENPLYHSSQLVENASRSKPRLTLFSSATTYLLISFLSVLVIVNSLISLFDAVNYKDSMGLALQLQVIPIASLFLLFSGLGILSNTTDSFHFPKTILNLIYAFAFGEEFFVFYTKINDPSGSGVESRYYDLMLVPIAVCLFSTLLEMRSTYYAKLGRGIGFISQGMWILQMGFSFFTSMISDGCWLSRRSRGNLSIKCKGHSEYHRGSAIATLEFNCHLAVVVSFGVGFYSVLRKVHGMEREALKYTPIGADKTVVHDDNHHQFSLESDDDENGIGVEMTLKGNVWATANN
ncbi:hypothetical protein M569_04682 [Genlisea aurea]|uniref:Uncharacterized protein n=1 Tax=Genlisea aurea TaxID=192259 RepID=S8CYI2_9LAMI|nr:hypothetical protein M569_04682 [Genlisea aurea]